MNFTNTKKLQNTKEQNEKGKITNNAKSNFDKRFSALSGAGNRANKQIVSFAIDSNAMEELDKYCKEHCSSRSALVNRLILEWCENQ